ncbi:MAG TPA: cytochrome c peroxidase [Burkholderiaceae bacterium]|nr:cytochrome c peroxidase [Burkholderiaceae bacterium]
MKHASRSALHRRVTRTALGLALLCGVFGAIADDDGPTQLRQYIGRQIGGLDRLKVPATNAEIPVPRQADGTVNYRYETTEAKRYLGKLLFHDPVRSARINVNTAVPLDLPAGTAFGGTMSASDPNIEAIANAQRRDTSCGTCHLGEAAGKAGQRINFASGGEGRGYTDENGKFVPRRRPQALLNKLRSRPLFDGDALVDALPTLGDIFIDANGQRVVTTPALFYHDPQPSALLATGRLDQLDSVGRQAPGMIGFAFNNRLLFGGIGGEVPSTPGSLNPFNDPAGENMTLLLLDAHRMLGAQSAELLKIPAFVQLFREAFPKEAAEADASGDMTKLVNDVTEFRAQATFLRTVVTRNTPFDKFLAGDSGALTPAQQRGAKLFFTKAEDRGAGCFGCHSGPMLNKQPDDPDVAGIGLFVEQNFFNIGIGDHPVQALNALARGHIDFNRLGPDGYPYHAEDTGREEITHNPNDMFKFRAMTLRQLKDARTFFHNGSFTKIRDVVQYFNAGIPQDPTAGAASTLSKRFTHPRGDGTARGLGLSDRQVDDLTDFLDNALYDPAFARYDSNSTTDTLQPNERDLAYSKHRPGLIALGAKDGVLLSGLGVASNDPLSRRDQGLEFLDVSQQAHVSIQSDRQPDHGRRDDMVRITNNSLRGIDTHLLVIVQGLSGQARLVNASGTTSNGEPYLRVFLPDGELQPGQSVVQVLSFEPRGDRDQRRGPPDQAVRYSVRLLSGQGNP